MQNMNILEPVLVLEQILNSIEVMSSPCVNYDAWRLVNDQVVLSFTDDVDWQIQYWRLHSNRSMDNLIAIFEDLGSFYLLIVDSYVPSFDGTLVILSWICFEFFNKGCQQLFSHPSSLGESSIDVGVWLHESERVYMNIVWFLLLSLIVLHCYIIIIIVVMEEGDKQGDKNSANYSRFLPIANIGRIMKKALPDNAKIAKDAKQTVQECVSEFISFITSEACEKCKNEKRKTINGEDILSSIQVLGFEGYNDILKMYLAKYRESVRANGETVGVEEKQQESEEEDEEDRSQDK